MAFVAGTSISFALIDIVIEHSSSVAPHSKYETKYTPVSLILIELLSGYSVKKATPFSGSGITVSTPWTKFTCVSVIEYLIP